MTTYNGHRNWDYWNVSLWIGNDEGLYNLARDCIRSTRTRRQAAAQFIEIMAAERKTKTPDGASYTIDKVMRAMTGFTK